MRSPGSRETVGQRFLAEHMQTPLGRCHGELLMGDHGSGNMHRLQPGKRQQLRVIRGPELESSAVGQLPRAFRPP